jgi:hypothetical protein
MRSTILAIAFAVAGCTATDTASFQITTAVAYSEPPAAQVEVMPARTGYVFVHGRYDRKNNGWTWTPGYWKRARVGYRWEEGRWERRGNSYHWVDGHWVSGSMLVPAVVTNAVDPSRPVVSSGYPTMAPPPARIENAGMVKAGWQAGRWDWREGRWQWIDGRLDPSHANQTWIAGRWESQGNYYVWIEGRWSAPLEPRR